MKSKTVLFCIILLALVAGGCQPAVTQPTATPEPPPTATPKPPIRILFIGDSLTYNNLGIDRHIKELAASASPSMTIKTSSVTRPNTTLEQHWENAKALEAIREETWDVVVLQENHREVAESAQMVTKSGEQEVDKFYEYARRFDEEAKQVGAQTVLYMTWENYFLTTEELVQVNNNIGEKLSAKVAPVGLAWMRAIEERPDLNLYATDGVHPNAKGTYLATCVLFATIYQQSPVNLAYQPADMIADLDTMKEEWEKWQMTDDEVAFLQRIAWETVVDYQAQ